MKPPPLSLLAFALCMSAFARNRAETETLGPSPWADTEMSTNVVFSIGESEMRNIVFSLDFDATPSNNVQVAFGKDADGDGALSPGEQELVVGWDCGKWLVEGRAGMRTAAWGLGVPRFCSLPATGTGHKLFSWRSMVSEGEVSSVEVSENGAPCDFSFPDPMPEWLYQPDWDMLRVTVRGIDRAEERFQIKATRVGTLMIIR